MKGNTVDQPLVHRVDRICDEVFDLQHGFAQLMMRHGENIAHFPPDHQLDHLFLGQIDRSEEHTSELQSPCNLVCRLLLEKKKKKSHAVHLDGVHRENG